MKLADSPNRMEDSFNQMSETLKPEHGYHGDCYRRFTKSLDYLKTSTEDSETIQQSRTSGRSSTAFQKVILKPDSIFYNKEGRKEIKEKSVWTTVATAVFECQSLKLQKTKRTRSSYRGSEVLISLHVKQVSTAAVAGSIRQAQLTGGVQMQKARKGRRTLKRHIGQPLQKFVM